MTDGAYRGQVSSEYVCDFPRICGERTRLGFLARVLRRGSGSTGVGIAGGATVVLGSLFRQDCHLIEVVVELAESVPECLTVKILEARGLKE